MTKTDYEKKNFIKSSNKKKTQKENFCVKPITNVFNENNIFILRLKRLIACREYLVVFTIKF